MPAALSKQEGTAGDGEAEAEAARRARSRVRNICISAFFSVCQHVMSVQTEPRLFLQLCGGDQGTAARLLGNTSGLVGLLSLLVNQVGGRLSDTMGRKPGFLLGPVTNIFLGLLVFRNSTNRTLVALCRILRLVVTSFSSTVMVDAALADACKKEDLKLAKPKVAYSIGISMLVTPFIEARLLGKGARYVYLALSGVAVAHAAFIALFLEETLAPAARSKFKLNLAALNPFSFLRVFTEGSSMLWQLTVLTTFQMFLEGKNISDTAQVWVRDHLKWSVTGIRNFVIIYGALCTLANAFLVPGLLRNLTPREFTSFTNCLNAVGFLARGLKASTWLWLGTMLPMLPGVNGNSAHALKAQATMLAEAEGFGNGEFSAWANNLRALVGSAAPVLYGQSYAAAQQRGINPGLTFAVAGVVGAILPEVMLRMMKDGALDRRPGTGA